MKLFIMFLFITGQVFALAPPPVNFTHDVIKANGNTYDVTFDGKKIEINKRESGSNVVGLIFLLAAIFWATVIGLILYKTGHLIDGIIVLLVIILVGHMIYTFKK